MFKKLYSHIMEGNSIDWVYVFHSFLLDAMTLEGIFLLLYFRAWIKIFHSYSAFNGAEHIA